MSERAKFLNQSRWAGAIYITGGGTSILPEVLSQPGASSTILDARIPYSINALSRLLKHQPKQACSQTVANDLAMTAYQNATEIGNSDIPIFGVGCTASIATNRERQGKDRFYIGIQTSQKTYNSEMILERDSRAIQESIIVESIWQGLRQTLDLEIVCEEQKLASLKYRHIKAPNPWVNIMLTNEVAATESNHDGKLLLPGAFNPLHRAHIKMLEISEEITGMEAAFELSIDNVDKPTLNFLEIEERLSQFHNPVWLTRLPTFVEKARHFPNSYFALGLDTFLRLIDSKYYATTADCSNAISEIISLGNKFIVFGREENDCFRTLEDIDIPSNLQKICIGISKHKFNESISSTILREGRPGS